MITSQAQLRTLYPEPAERARRKQLSALDGYCRQFIALSPLCVLATGGAEDCLMDASPRGGVPGFVHVHDAHTLWIPDAGGNNRLDSLSNLLSDPRIGLLFLIPGVNETLRINGRAQLRDEQPFTQKFASDHFVPKLVIEVHVQEAYLHCAKALMRSRLWQADAQCERSVLPSMNQMIHAQLGLDAVPEPQSAMEQRYQQQIALEVGKA
ncbi:pyridoxamine 5'-phosphate oxidase family protein [Comamonas sp. NoAH]|uniref:pyridoxamine 5'-phosphate oxidase family protein n=1 Tax=Comamonas halotolerans TaxID=3041496 RepID=UPI0024E13119|nr:pyridoxamine 5'-phosphate oxidase family protein [Comamonas sp. NoAH]